MLLDIERRQENETGLLTLSGVLDISTVDDFKRAVEYFGDVQELIIDFAKIGFIDSTGVSGIIYALKQFQARNKRIRIKAISADVYEILDILGLPEIFGRDIFEISL